ncbi:MAG: hypothetical protein JRJ16_12750 [Deltaproteobacteria bacterium]|nr:hypothetical protein [Deltaproteobacteria bacterium]
MIIREGVAEKVIRPARPGAVDPAPLPWYNVFKLIVARIEPPTSGRRGSISPK